MRPSMAAKQSAAFAQVCAACRQQAARSLSTTRIAATPPGSAARRPTPTQPLQQPPPSLSRRWLSQTPANLSARSDSATTAPDAAAQDPSSSTTATSSVSGAPRPSPPSYYALFPETLPEGPPPRGAFHIDVRALRREFLRLQAAAHPDLHYARHGGAGASGSADRRRAEAASALINGAFRTLANPLLRAQYLLREQFGLDLAGDEAGAVAGVDEEVLGQVLEAREVIEEAEEEGDLEGLREENEERIRLAEESIGRAFGEGDVEALKREVVRLRYWVNIRESIDNWEQGKGVVLEH